MGSPSGDVTPIPLQITFRGMDPSAAVEAAIRQRAAGLERFTPQIMRFHVIVDMPHQHRHTGNTYAIRIDITTASGAVFVARDPGLDGSRKDFQAVLRDAFDAAARHLEHDAQRQQGHDASPRGNVTRLYPEAGYGFLTTGEGEEIYFHQNSVSGAAFAQLRPGSPVGFTLAPEGADEGARANSVQLLPA